MLREEGQVGVDLLHFLANPMLLYLLPLASFILFLFSNSLEMRLLLLRLQHLRAFRLVFSRTPSSNVCANKMVERIDHVEEEEVVEERSVLDLPELALDLILERLSPAGLCNMSMVCSSFKDRCRSDHLWGRHLREKWGHVISNKALNEWQSFATAKCEASIARRRKGVMGSLSQVWPLNCMRSNAYPKPASSLPAESAMALYLSLESGMFWLPAQVYNRENGHSGFLMSCYDAELSYNWRSDTFRARYLPHGKRSIVFENAIHWDRIRAPPVDTSPHDLHISDCLSDLRPSDHIEIQWRRNKEYPYGWWYGVVGHLETCDGNELYCRCHKSDTIALEFNHYGSGSRWRQATINRKDHREDGNEANGFYGGIRKLHSNDEISTWKRLWPTESLQ